MTAPDTGLEFSWLTRAEDLFALSGEWQALCDELGAEIYLSPDWLTIWWEHFARGRALQALVVRDGNDALVGVLPFYLDRLGVPPLSLNVARLAGTDPYTLILRPPVEPAYLPQVLTRAVTDLTGAFGRADIISFTPLSARSQLWAALSESTVPGLQMQNQESGLHMMFDLPDQFDAYMAKLSKKRRAQVRRERRNLAEEIGLEARTTHPDAAEFDDFIAFHNAQWQSVGKGGHFTDWPGSVDFYRDLAAKLQAKKTVWFLHMDAESARMSSQFCLVSGQTCHWRLPARSTDVAFAKISLGKIGLVSMIEELIAAGVTEIEAGIGFYDYKKTFGASEVPIQQVILASQCLKTRLLLPVALLGAKALHLAYYRIWFGRLAPKLSQAGIIRPRALWRLWIRSRL